VQARHDVIPDKIAALRQHKQSLQAELGLLLRDEANARVAEVEARVDEQARALADLRAQLRQTIE